MYVTHILNIIEDLRKNNPTLRPDDIGIMFLENINNNYKLANTLQRAVGEKYDILTDLEITNKMISLLISIFKNDRKLGESF